MQIQTATLGYPRIGKNREVKKALEAFWSGNLESESLLQTVRKVEESNWKSQLEAGIDHIGIGDTTLYDHVLDWTFRFGLIPERFQQLSGLERYFTMARGKEGIPALEMTKWFDTNYHYLVPEIAEQTLPSDFSDFLERVSRAQKILGKRAIPIVLGPCTLLRLSKLSLNIQQAISKLIPLYINLLTELKNLGVEEVQIHEPALVLGDTNSCKSHFKTVYQSLSLVEIPLHLVTYFDDLGETYPWVMELPVSAISLDFTRGRNLELIKTYGFPANKRLGAGIIDARNIWQIRSEKVIPILQEIVETLHGTSIHIQPSASLQFVPYDAKREKRLPSPLRNVLSFAEQKLQEVVFLARTIIGENTKIEQEIIETSWNKFEEFNPANQSVEERLKTLKTDDFQRSLSYGLRLDSQISLPLFPTTTIGSFPQTSEVRQLRMRYKRGELSQSEYETAIDVQIAESIKLQEELGLDVLVHGEFERTDMVEFFGQQLSGFAFTENGWVQSYGSRYVRPPIIYGDVVRTAPMTVREFKVAQSLTEKPVKGMLTAPVTILNWSYPRIDISRSEQAFQIALALRDEVADLEAAGAKVIQVDEPALREGLPLKVERWNEYLSWAVDAFRLATAIAQPQTQIHTHMCYCEFGDIIKDIERLDADVISIENSRSNNQTLREITEGGYSHQVGNGVYDIHSPVVPTTEQILQQLRTGIANLPVKQIWVNPDCGLKTRRWSEVIPALKNMVEATKVLREEANVTVK
ncbi:MULTISPECIES: 5-methyltetrahydropteroyltriglutamate--homocysteine S-methyltransferase [Nostoc]|uniref:5-methyltetrahydropteroyltriglutamate--homocysteine methyltransferase n=1 Tax=Nostoc punctiforme FACHB-252 TaxID=1357509 RepID=A0ABR8HJY5_NOSPU|nr:MULTISPECIES: 5-methyltetrahydropteroyltriglutamate--homocysteine S-methyltransferase [Nostoc]MBC1237096.1 5-methyltetrahydropteroyltriglutamate--homocysteine S-methyltransferase [Nostoc sp. 2RC]MBD2615591.1 5-methyltetrahydropteroyltriglutamate--homocysteine S-methyltransferase [Nostoc punctiforme FACHB-252]